MENVVVVRDYIKTELIEKKKNSLKMQLWLSFSLNDVKNPNDEHSFGISIINNRHTEIITVLEKLENKKGENIEFDKIYEIDYLFETEQIIIIKPIINNIINEDKKFTVSVPTLLAKKNYEKCIENIGNLIINCKKLDKNNIELNTEISKFDFSITLYSKKIFNSEKSLRDIFYVIRNVKHWKKKRPVYKSHEYNFKLNEPKETSSVKIESNLLCNDNDMPIYFELYSPSINQSKNIGTCSFTLNSLNKQNLEDKPEQLQIKNEDKIIGIVRIKYRTKKK